MVGMGALLECLDDPRVQSVLVVGRNRCSVQHPKLTEIIHGDFFNFAPIQHHFGDCDACFFCLGVSAAGLSEEAYHHLTYDLTMAAARAMVAANPNMVFCYISGAGTDSTEQGRMMWARVKGKTENALLRLPFKAVYCLRPGFIQPMRGVRTKTRGYRVLYTLVTPLFPVLHRLFPRLTTTSVTLGHALIHLAVEGDQRRILESAEIDQLGS
jgi:uncharacterized protein YbjT (DUF2867 family)